MKSFNRLLHILLVEDSEDDALLLEIAIKRSGASCVCRRVETANELSAALDAQNWDVIIADYLIPNFGGLEALAMVKARELDVPFIIVSGHINEDTAVAAMKAGAHDYVMKDKLARLVPAIAREMREAEMRQARRRSESDLREEQVFRAAIETCIPSGIAVVGLDGSQSYVNHAFCKMVGWTEGELLGKKPPFDYWPEEEREKIIAALANVIQGQGPSYGLEVRLCTKSGERFDTLMLMTPLKDAFDNLTGWLSSITDITERKRAEDALRRSHEDLEVRVRQRTVDLSAANAQLQAALAEGRRLEHELLEITDNERRRIGLNLHDDLGQKLTGIVLMSKGLEIQLAKRGSEGAAEAAQIHKLVKETMTQARDLSHDMVTLESQGKDLTAALEEIVSRVKRNFKVACRFECETKAATLDSSSVTQLYRIAQEAVTNAIKHGKAKNVDIRLSNGGDRLLLSIRNDGARFPSVVKTNDGIGLRIMHYRANLIGASLEVKPGEEEGAVVTCSLPVSEPVTVISKRKTRAIDPVNLKK